jgi:glutamate synthase domain-containing protein 3
VVWLLLWQAQLRGIVSDYYEATGSSKAKALLDDWANSVKRFWQVRPEGERGEASASVGPMSLKSQSREKTWCGGHGITGVAKHSF